MLRTIQQKFTIMKPIVLLMSLIISVCANSYGQSDYEIVKATLGKNYFEMHKSLDALGVWYHLHMDFNKLKSGKTDTKKVYSIADGKGNVRVWSIKLNQSNIVDEIIINYRHDSKVDVEAIGESSRHASFHVGMYSTDISFQK